MTGVQTCALPIYLDATTELSRQIAALGIYPAVDPLASTSNILAPEIVGDRHYAVARQVQSVLQRYKELVEHHFAKRVRRAVTTSKHAHRPIAVA